MLLESFRNDEVGRTYFALTNDTGKEDISKSILASYIEYSFRAFYFTMQDIEQLENAKSIVPSGNNSITSVSLWFLSLESYINTLLKLTCLYTKNDFTKIINQSITSRLSYLLKLLNVDDLLFKKKGVYSRVSDFLHFRNELFHDRNVGNKMKFTKTNYSEIPFYCNYIDVIQSILIFLEITSALRYVISGLDTMPDILINANNKIFHKKLDVLYLELIKPSMNVILEKHSFTTKLNFDIPFIESLHSGILKKGDAVAFVYVDSYEQYKVSLNERITNYVGQLFFNIIQKEDIDSKHFRLGKYTL